MSLIKNAKTYALAGLLLSGGTLVAQNNRLDKSYQTFLTTEFKKADQAPVDYYITQTELNKYMGNDAFSIDTFDKNGDNKLNIDEFASMINQDAPPKSPKPQQKTQKSQKVQKSERRSITLESGSKVVIENGQTQYYDTYGNKLSKENFEKQEGKIEIRPSGRYAIVKNGQPEFYAADGTPLNPLYFMGKENLDLKNPLVVAHLQNENRKEEAKEIANQIHDVATKIALCEGNGQLYRPIMDRINGDNVLDVAQELGVNRKRSFIQPIGNFGRNCVCVPTMSLTKHDLLAIFKHLARCLKANAAKHNYQNSEFNELISLVLGARIGVFSVDDVTPAFHRAYCLYVYNQEPQWDPKW